MNIYHNQSARAFIRTFKDENGLDTIVGDPQKMAKVIVDYVDENKRPLRLAWEAMLISI
jgi:hypothetical protein